jgi:hypothetical protein
VFIFPFLGHQLCSFNPRIGFLSNSRHPDDATESFHAVNRGLLAVLVVLAILSCELVWHMLEPVLLAFNHAT